ncbi:MAG TPA: MauE/DoxX family redox-associated membrane protein, partial [Actinomycetota bacterium]|nr:MauE/DoxX family redox-associated membrane protein [Actinomycetota bacterium]
METITPVGHGGRRGRWLGSVLLRTLGATIAAAAFGAALGLAGRVTGAPWGATGVVAAIAIGVVYAARELTGLPVPIPDRRAQVPQWWREQFGVRTASLLYGFGLGIGFLTYLRHGTLVAVSAVALAIGDPLTGILLIAPFGFARGVAVLVAKDATSTEGVEDAANRVERWSRWARTANGLALLAVAVAAWWLVARGPAGAPSAAALLIALVFAAAAISKLADIGSWRSTLKGYGLPGWVERPASFGVPGAELGVAALALLNPGVGGLAAVSMLVGFSWAIIRARRLRGNRVPCGCFGGKKVRDARLLLARNAMLMLLALAAVASASNPVGLRGP